MTALLITRETDYALRILRTLLHGEQLPASKICERELLPRHFVYKILKKLERARLVQAARGSEGGFRLIADLRKISLYDLMEFLENRRPISACMEPGFRCAWQERNRSECTVYRQLKGIQNVLDTEMRARSLYEMLSGPCGGIE